MPLDLSKETLLIRFTGLGITCLNPVEKRLETLFIHDKNHRLRINIFETVTLAEQKKHQGYRSKNKNYPGKTSGLRYVNGVFYKLKEVFDEENLQTASKNARLVIEIKGDEESAVLGYEVYTGTEFERNRADASDPHDFRWVVDVEKEKILSKNNLKPRENASFRVTRMFISNARLFTEKLGKYEDRSLINFKRVEIADERNGVLKSNSDTDFGPLAEYIGAAIQAPKVELVIKKDEKLETRVFSANPKSAVLIEIDNSDPDPENRESDMKIYRKFWKVPRTEIFDLWTSDEVEKFIGGGSPIGIHRICNGVFSSENESIEVFTKN